MCSWRGCCTLGANPLRNDTQCEHCEGTGCVESCNQNHSGAPECQIVEQYVYKVTKFSSQYGADKSISYAAGNLIGPPYVFPQHGDSTRTCVFRTYGTWWSVAPSASKQFGRIPAKFCSDDFVEIQFKSAVYPTEIKIFETYNPGAVVKIMACDQLCGTDVDSGQSRWECLWSGPPERFTEHCRVFSPNLKPASFLTNLLRIEFCHQLLHYYTEIDAIQLAGYTIGTIQSFQPYTKTAAPKSPVKDIIHDEAPTNGGYFQKLPGEILFFMLNYLDQLSLSRLSQTCRYLREHTYDSFLWMELNLKPYWHQVNNSTLIHMANRCSMLQKLDISWCSVLSSGLHSLFMATEEHLVCLQLACCDFVTVDTLHLLATYCPNLQELDLQHCLNIEETEFESLGPLPQLLKLNLYSTKICTQSAQNLLKYNPQLEVLNLGCCSKIDQFDGVADHIAQHCRNMRCVDLWRARSLTHTGLFSMINNNTNLEELDLGWCSSVISSSGCFIELLQKCQNLKKLFLTANRTVCDNDLNAIAEYGHNLEQLDILGTAQVREQSAFNVLQSCSRLKFFDVSFCANISCTAVNSWCQEFPHVAIKKSYQPHTIF